jgi:hypothetical protein
MGALLLADLDATLEKHGFLGVRFMDAILVLTPTRWTLRVAVRLVQQGLARWVCARIRTKRVLGRSCEG